MASDSWLFKQHVLLKQFEVVVRLFIPFVFIAFFRKFALPPKARFPFLIYSFLIFYMLTLSFISEHPIIVALNTVKFLYILSFPISLILVLQPQNFSHRFLYTPVFLGVFLAAQTIILFILIQSYHPPPGYSAVLVGYKNMKVLNYGLWGYAHGMMAIGSAEQVYRAQSFFGEPTEFASFMEVATILSYGFYKVEKNKAMLLISLLCAVSLVLTFSMTAYIVVLLGFCFYKLVFNWKKMGIVGPSLALAGGIILSGVILFYFYSASHPLFYGRSRWGFAFGHSPREITIRIEALINSLKIFWNNPLGIGLIAHRDSSILQNYSVIGSRLAPLGWMIHAGLVGIFTQFLILYYVLKKIIIKQLRKKDSFERYLALSFVVLTLHQCLAGAWFSALFFYLLVCVIATDTYGFNFSGNQVPKQNRRNMH